MKPKIIAVTGSRDLPASHAAIIRMALNGAEYVITGDAKGADEYARTDTTLKGVKLQVFSVDAELAKVNIPAALAQRSIEMVKYLELLTEKVLVAFPVKPCPAEIKKVSRQWIGCGSGTWSTLAMAAGRSVRVVVYPFGQWFFPVWPGHIWESSSDFPGAFELISTLNQKELF